MICLDTNAVIAAINRRKLELRRRLESAIAADAPIGIPTIVLFEMRYGIAKSARPQENAAILAVFLTLDVSRLGPSSWRTPRRPATFASSLSAPARRSLPMTS
jgi:predicted nucleic acid-binding protein